MDQLHEAVERDRAEHLDRVEDEAGTLLSRLERTGQDGDALMARIGAFSVAVPSWGVGTGGTRFARFPGRGEPRNISEKLRDCAVIQSLTRMTPAVSPHFPWDSTKDYGALKDEAAEFGLAFDAVNSNTFQDQPGQAFSYKFGSLTHTDPAVRAQAVAHNIDCIRIGEQIGSNALTVWIADGSNFAGQQDFAGAFQLYLDSMADIYAALPADWQLFIEHKMFEPAFYSTVIADWGSSLLAAQSLGPQANCLVDLGHHAPNTNIEMIIARLHHAGKLGGFHFNDSKYGDDDLDSGSVKPFQLFLCFNELVKAEARGWGHAPPAYMMDQSHNVTDPIESLTTSAEAIAIAHTQALIVDRDALADAQESNDALMAAETLKSAYRTDVRPLIALARMRAGGPADPIRTYRASSYRNTVAQDRPALASSGGGIV
ncbi:MAG: TIM barrel protein [Pseudomonadota bacterium]